MIDWGFRGSQFAHDDWSKYDLLGQAELLTDEGQQEPIERAIRSQGLSVRGPLSSHDNIGIEKNRLKAAKANYCEDNLRVTAALFYDFHWRHSRNAKITREKANTKRKRWLFGRLSKRPGSEAVHDALHVHYNGFLRPLMDVVTTGELTAFWELQNNKIRTTVAILDGYMTAGAAISKGGRAPYGLSVMVEALVAEGILDRAARTAETYYSEMEGAAVLHYLIHTNGLHEFLGPVYPTEKTPKKENLW